MDSKGTSQNPQDLLEQLELITDQIEHLQLTVDSIKRQLSKQNHVVNNQFNDETWEPFDETEEFNINDQVVIIHSSQSRRQVGTEGVITKITNKFVWVDTEDEILQKHKKYVTSKENYEDHKAFYIAHRVS